MHKGIDVVRAAELCARQFARRPEAIKRRRVVERVVREQAAYKAAACSCIHCDDATAVARMPQQWMQPWRQILGIDDRQHRGTGGLQDLTKGRVAT